MKYLLYIIIALTFSLKLYAENDSTIVVSYADTVNIPYYNTHGKLTQILDFSDYRINKFSLHKTDYTTLSEIIVNKIPVLNQSLGSYGQYANYSNYAGLSHTNAFQFGGRDITNMDNLNFNIDYYSPEFFENIEVYSGSNAVILGINSSGSLLNYQNQQYNSKLPYTKLWVQEAATDMIAVDGIFAQNIGNDMNLNFGFKSMNDRGRYSNSGLKSWNVRGGFRYAIDSTNSINITNVFSHFFIGNYGGISPISRNYFETIEAISNYSDFNIRNLRHDLNIEYASKDLDESRSMNFIFYFSNSQYEILRPEEFVFDSSGNENLKYSNSYLGAKANFELKISSIFEIIAGGDVKYVDVNKSDYYEDWAGLHFTAYGLGKINFSSKSSLSGGVKYSNIFTNSGFAFGSRYKQYFGTSFAFWADYSVSARFPSIVEGIALNSEKHNLFLAGIQYSTDNFELKSTAFFRYVLTPITTSFVSKEADKVILSFKNDDAQTFFGGNFQLNSLLLSNLIAINDKLNLKFETQIQRQMINSIASEVLPLFYTKVALDYFINIGRSNVNLGIESSLIDKFKGRTYLPFYGEYINWQGDNLPMSMAGTNVYAMLKLGSTYLKVYFQNILSNGYYYTAIYPVQNRNLRITVSSSFFD